METHLLVIAIIASVVAASVGVACLIRIDQLETLVRHSRQPWGKGSQLSGRGKLVQWPGNPPRRPR